MRLIRPSRLFVVAALMAAALIPAQSAFAFTDVPSSYWDYSQITYATPWMSDYGASTFKPTANEIRDYLCRTLVQMFDPSEPIDPSIHFSDLADSDPFYRYANVCVKKNWLPKYSNDRWAGGSSVPRSLFDQSLVMAMGSLGKAVTGLQKLHEANGSTPYTFDSRWPYMQLATWLGLHYDHSDESMDLEIKTNIHRDEVAYSLSTAKHLQSWQVSNATTLFGSVTLPTLDPHDATQLAQQQLTQFAFDQVGFPYIWGGEWNAKSPSGYCCGSQPQGGFDCSGFVWWVLKKNEDGYDAAQFRPYAGWSIHDRTSSTMAEHAATKLTLSQLQIGNIMFFASDGGHTWQDVDHVGIFVGNGWMMHSTSGGPQLESITSGWYHDHYVWGRKLTSSSLAAASGSLSTGEAAVRAG